MCLSSYSIYIYICICTMYLQGLRNYTHNNTSALRSSLLFSGQGGGHGDSYSPYCVHPAYVHTPKCRFVSRTKIDWCASHRKRFEWGLSASFRSGPFDARSAALTGLGRGHGGLYFLPPNLDGFKTVRKMARFHDGSLPLAPTAVHIRSFEPPRRFEPFHRLESWIVEASMVASPVKPAYFLLKAQDVNVLCQESPNQYETMCIYTNEHMDIWKRIK